MSTNSRQSIHKVTLLATVGVIVIGALVLLAIWLLTRDSRQDLSLAEIAKPTYSTNDYASEALTGLAQDTEILCAGEDGCIEGYASPKIKLLRFDTKEHAASFAARTPGSHHSDWIVIDYYAPGLSEKGKQEIENLIDSTWTSD